jgi:hypothetical protein
MSDKSKTGKTPFIADYNEFLAKKARPGKPFMEIRLKSGMNEQIYSYTVKKSTPDKASIRAEIHKAVDHMLDKILGKTDHF